MMLDEEATIDLFAEEAELALDERSWSAIVISPTLTLLFEQAVASVWCGRCSTHTPGLTRGLAGPLNSTADPQDKLHSD
eukprot:scaffold166220_cov33-Tisochrysis_lutea.AAC.2